MAEDLRKAALIDLNSDLESFDTRRHPRLGLGSASPKTVRDFAVDMQIKHASRYPYLSRYADTGKIAKAAKDANAAIDSFPGGAKGAIKAAGVVSIAHQAFNARYKEAYRECVKEAGISKDEYLRDAGRTTVFGAKIPPVNNAKKIREAAEKHFNHDMPATFADSLNDYPYRDIAQDMKSPEVNGRMDNQGKWQEGPLSHAFAKSSLTTEQLIQKHSEAWRHVTDAQANVIINGYKCGADGVVKLAGPQIIANQAYENTYRKFLRQSLLKAGIGDRSTMTFAVQQKLIKAASNLDYRQPDAKPAPAKAQKRQPVPTSRKRTVLPNINRMSKTKGEDLPHGDTGMINQGGVTHILPFDVG